MAIGRLWEDFDDKEVDTSWVSLPYTRSSKPGKPGVFGADVTKSPASSDLALLLEASDRSDELERVRPGRAGRHRGERKGDGLKDRAKLAMVIGSAGAWEPTASGARGMFMPRLQPLVGGETCFDASARKGRRLRRASHLVDGLPLEEGLSERSRRAREGCSRPDKLLLVEPRECRARNLLMLQ